MRRIVRISTSETMIMEGARLFRSAIFMAIQPSCVSHEGGAAGDDCQDDQSALQSHQFGARPRLGEFDVLRTWPAHMLQGDAGDSGQRRIVIVYKPHESLGAPSRNEPFDFALNHQRQYFS